LGFQTKEHQTNIYFEVKRREETKEKEQKQVLFNDTIRIYKNAM
jgi:hypothetical protein